MPTACSLQNIIVPCRLPTTTAAHPGIPAEPLRHFPRLPNEVGGTRRPARRPAKQEEAAWPIHTAGWPAGHTGHGPDRHLCWRQPALSFQSVRDRVTAHHCRRQNLTRWRSRRTVHAQAAPHHFEEWFARNHQIEPVMQVPLPSSFPIHFFTPHHRPLPSLSSECPSRRLPPAPPHLPQMPRSARPVPHTTA